RLGAGVPRPRARGAGGRLGRGGDRARQPLRVGALRGDRHARHGGGPRLPARRRRGLRLRQRLDALHRRRRVRHGRRDRQLDAEAARARPDRPARAVHVQVRRRRRRPRAPV
ncbi:MAG: Gamma-glutamyl phosphate reductase, partial [uncultured Solirubrobacteraceae bacterium]